MSTPTKREGQSALRVEDYGSKEWVTAELTYSVL